ncbi:hypothetical protein PVAG01_09499 [Phlyctema vagabunda]|uniref:Uncharacterized protein n=1 Tax=Phlyctema vagabunda TaxID=108571 RepID=A0ABR4P7P3_9HELO
MFAGLRTSIVGVLGQENQRYMMNNVGTMKRIACGCMNGSAAFMPLLYPQSLGLRGMFYADLAVFSISLTAFCFLHMCDIVKNAPYALASATLLFILTATSSQTSLEQFTPYIPFSVAITLSATVHVIPGVLLAAQNIIHGGREQDIRLHDSTAPFARSNSPLSMRSLRRDSILGRYFESQPSDFLFSHMDHAWTHPTRTPGSGSEGTDIDLELGLVPPMEASVGGDETDLLL